jgi:hypothetical protein
LSYEGFELIANAPEDARDPARTLPRACLIAADGVIALDVPVAFVAVGEPVAARHRHRQPPRAGRRRPLVPRPGRLHADRGRRGGVHLKPGQRDPVRPAKFTCLMGRDGELPARFGQPV